MKKFLAKFISTHRMKKSSKPKKLQTNIILIAYVTNSAHPVLKTQKYQELDHALKDQGTVCYTGRERDPELEGLIDLRDISFGILHELTKYTEWVISPDTSIPFVTSNTPNNIITIRQDRKFHYRISAITQYLGT